jgi:hypothetical protein
MMQNLLPTPKCEGNLLFPDHARRPDGGPSFESIIAMGILSNTNTNTTHHLPLLLDTTKPITSTSTAIMPPKKKDEGPPLPRFGRVGNNLKMGIVGLPNIGKVS